MKFISSHVLMIVLAVASIQSDNVEGGDATVRRDKKKTAHRLVRGQRKLNVLNAGCGGAAAAAAAANSPAADAVASSPEPEKSSGKSGGKSGKDKRRRNLADCDEEPGSEAPSETSESEAVSGVDEVSQKDLPTNEFANSDPPRVPGRDQTSNIEEVWVDGN